jgi:hypothetical protein
MDYEYIVGGTKYLKETQIAKHSYGMDGREVRVPVPAG